MKMPVDYNDTTGPRAHNEDQKNNDIFDIDLKILDLKSNIHQHALSFNCPTKCLCTAPCNTARCSLAC